MPTLISLLSSGKGTWTEVIKIINSQNWNKVFLITNEFGKENFKISQNNVKLVIVNFFKEAPEIVAEIKKQLHGQINDFEIALNFVSGTGKEHMALMEAVLELGLNFRLITLNNGIVEVLGIEK